VYVLPRMTLDACRITFTGGSLIPNTRKRRQFEAYNASLRRSVRRRTKGCQAQDPDHERGITGLQCCVSLYFL
jgi:hypothetical protein